MNNQLINWLLEFVQRFFTKSPKFFKVITITAAISTALTGLPDLLQWFGISNLPAWATILENKTIAIASAVALILSKLPSQSQPVAVIASGTVAGDTIVKATDSNKLPFTANDEAKKTNTSSLPTVEQTKS